MADHTTRLDFRPIIITGVYAALPPHERAALEQWERENLDGRTVASSDWPGWDKYIGPAPTPEPRYEKADIPNNLRRAVFARDGYACLHCGATETLCADHIVPEVKGGPTTLENLQTLCNRCNARKGWKS